MEITAAALQAGFWFGLHVEQPASLKPTAVDDAAVVLVPGTESTKNVSQIRFRYSPDVSCQLSKYPGRATWPTWRKLAAPR